MKLLTISRNAAFTAGAIGMILLTPAMGAQAQDNCKTHSHVGSARGWSVSRVRNNAVSMWEQQARTHDGPSWANFVVACDKSLVCRRFPGRVQCTARGRPGASR
jgi:hypothetical protein